MPFREGYGGVYDEATLARLQDIFEYVWLALADFRAFIFHKQRPLHKRRPP